MGDHRYKSNIKPIVLTALLFMLLGTAMELYLLDHFESMLQSIPLICIGILLLLVFLSFFQNIQNFLRPFKLVLLLTGLCGLYGAFLHLQANYEFEMEMKPTASKWDLILDSASGALPALAPCSMIVLALIGYSYIKLLKTENDDKI